MKDGKITIKNDKGETLECDVLFTFESDEKKKNYIAYTDNTLDEHGNIKVYASTYDPKGKDLELKPIQTDEEWDVINNILVSVQEKVKKDLKEESDSNGED